MQRLLYWTQRTNSSWLLWTTKAFGSMLLIVFLVSFGPSFDPGKMDPWGGYALARGGDDGGDSDDSGSDSGGDNDSGSDDSGSDSGGDDDSGSDDSGSDSGGDDDSGSDDSGSDSSGDDDSESDDSGRGSSSDDDDSHDANHDRNDDDSSDDRRGGHAGESEDDGFDRRRGADGPEDDGIHQHRGGQIDDVRRTADDSRNRSRRLVMPESSPGSVDDSSRGQVEAGDDKGGQRQLRGLGVIDDLSEVSTEEERSLLGNW